MKNCKKKYLNSIFLCAVLFAVQNQSFSESFQNNLLKTEIKKSSISGVKFTLYTSKPYHDNIVVNKKNDTEYVILMPETANSMTSKPSVKAVSDMIGDVQVKTQQYQNGVKGYTKITISSKKPVEISTQTQTLKTEESLTDKDYSELLAQSEKKKVSKTQTSAKKKSSTKTKETSKKTLSSVENKTEKLKKVSSVEKTKIQKSLAKQEPSKIEQKTAQKTLPKAEPTKVPQKPQLSKEKIVQTEAKKQELETPQVKTEQPQNLNQVSPIVTPEPPKPQNISRVQKYKQKIKNIVKNNLYLTLGAIASIFLLLLLAARKTAKNAKKQKEFFKQNLEQKPDSAIDYSEKIDESMDWRTKFKTYKETSQQQETPTEEEQMPQQIDSQELDELFSNPSENENEINENQENEDFYNQETNTNSDFEENIIERPEDDKFGINLEDVDDYSLEEISEASIDDIFSEENEEIFEPHSYNEEIISPIASEQIEENEEDELVKSEFKIDNVKGFYLVDFEDSTALVGHIEEEIFVLKRFDNKVSAKIQARVNEQKGTSTNYMTKVGGFKGIVEVTPERMNLLIEL